MVGQLWVFKSLGLTHESFFFKTSLQECVVNIKLMECPLFLNCQRQHKTNGCGFDDWTESLLEINTWTLCEPFCDKSGFVTVDCAIKFPLNSKEPLAVNYILCGIMRYQLPSVVSQKCFKFRLHCCPPLRVFLGLFECGRDEGSGCLSHVVEDLFWLVYVALGMSGWPVLGWGRRV